MHSRVLRSECSSIISKSLGRNNTVQIAKRVHRLPQRPDVHQRRSASMVPSTLPTPPTPPPESPDDLEKPRRGRPRIKTTDSKPGEGSSFPVELADSLIWLPDDNVVIKETSLPPEEMIRDAMANLHVSFHSKMQHRATFPSNSGQPIEPSLTLYCPIEGGTYVIDTAVRELSTRTGADVLVLDAVDFLAGEWGPFGKAASCLQLPSNPLQLGEFQNPQRNFRADDSDDEEGFGMNPVIAHAMEGIQSGRPPFGITLRRNKTSSSSSVLAKKAFFQDFVNLQRDTEDAAIPTTIPGRPRLIYCRDFQLLSDSLSHWYPHFIEAVRLRRQGPIPRPQSPVYNPTIIVFGISPSIVTPRSAPFSSPDSGSFLNVMTNRNRPSSRVGPSAGPRVMEWDESPAAQRARDKRLHEKLSNWEKHDASVFNSELPNVQSALGEAGGQRNQGKGLMSLFVAIPDGGGGPPSITPGPPDEDPSRDRTTEQSRVTVLLPRMRDVAEETSTRMQRRLDMNQVNMRTAVGAIGGDLSKNDDLNPVSFDKPIISSDDDCIKMMASDWSQRVETWQRTKAIADRAMGSFVSEEFLQALEWG
ncbi:hypothetical protein FS842_000615 [Serendipita sp. 407]|nr:hypothetical protein FS842_000615 [Serendipita sp. 407]